MTIERRRFLEAGLGLASFPALIQAQAGRSSGELVMAPPGQSRVQTDGSFVFKVAGSDTAGRYSVMESGTVTPPLHVHHAQDELFYVLEGEFGFQVGNQKFKLGRGGSVLGPRGLPHGFIAVGGSGKLLIMFEPAGTMEAFLTETTKLTANGQRPSPAILAAVFRQHGLEIVGPALTEASFS